ncbi:MAG: PEGA domain-containing protein [Candidatus Saccharimonadales bacterium]
MNRRPLRRRQSIIRGAIYTFMTLSVVIIVTMLMFVVLGYQFNERDGKIEQGGLLQLASIPTGANVTLDNKHLNSRTNTKSNVAVGNHGVSFIRDGYRTWKKSIDIDAGEIGWMSYARLIPTTVTPQSVRNFASLSSVLTSPKRNYMLLHEVIDKPVFTLANIQGDTVQYTTLSLPVTSYTEPAVGSSQTFTMDSWSENEASVLIRHNYDDSKIEWLLLDRNSPDRSINISTTFGITPSKIVFAGKSDRLLFAQTDDAVRRINVDEQTLSRPLASKVNYFTVYDDKTIAYATSSDDKQRRTVGYAAIDIPEPVTLETLPADDQSLYITMSTYFSKRFVAVLHGQTLTIKAGMLPTKTNKGTLKKVSTQTIPAGATSLSSEHNSRFVVMQLPDGYATYDIELDKYDRTVWTNPQTAQRSLNWIDEYIIWSDNGGMLRLYEFDGANQQNIMPVSEGFSASVSPNNKYIYGILKTNKGFDLRRAKLIIE